MSPPANFNPKVCLEQHHQHPRGLYQITKSTELESIYPFNSVSWTHRPIQQLIEHQTHLAFSQQVFKQELTYSEKNHKKPPNEFKKNAYKSLFLLILNHKT